METDRKKHEDRLIKIFVELCDLLPTFNYKEGTQTITFEEAAQAASKENGSDLDCIPAPQERQLFVSCLFLFHTDVLHRLQQRIRGLEQGGGATAP